MARQGNRADPGASPALRLAGDGPLKPAPAPEGEGSGERPAHPAALVSEEESGAVAEVVLGAPYDGAMLAALRARLAALGAKSAIPRRVRAQEVTLSVRGLPAALLRDRLAAEPPPGFRAEVAPADPESSAVHVRLRAEPSEAVRKRP